MSSNDWEVFKLVSHLGNDQLMNIVETNLKMWLDWAFLKIGGWTEVALSQASVWGGDYSLLRSVDDDNYTDGQVWEGIRKDWVWETGVDYVDIDSNTQNPLVVGTPQIDGNPTAASYHINYPLGRVIFDSALDTDAEVKVAHSFRNVQVYRADDAPWWTELQYKTFRADHSHFAQTSDGSWSVGGHHRIQMPTIIIETVPRGDATGFELGSGALDVNQDILLHIMAESRADRNKYVDILRAQKDKTIWLFNTNDMNAAEDYPLDSRGELIASPKMYPELVDTAANGGYRWIESVFLRSVVSEVESIHPALHEGVVRLTLEIIWGRGN